MRPARPLGRLERRRAALLPAPLSLGLAAVLALLGMTAGCGESGPRYSLKQVMYQMEQDQLAAEKVLGDPDGVPALLERLRSIELYSDRAYFEAYSKRPVFAGNPARFFELYDQYRARLDEALAAAESGDPGAASMAWARLRMSCEVCHVEYRPER